MTARRRLRPRYPHPDEVRMTLGEHLEELRTRLIRAIAALVVGAVVCFIFRSYTLAVLTWPMTAVLKSRGMDPALKYFNPTEMFLTDVKIALIMGLILSAPYGLVQLWGFIAAGLYPNERRWVHRFAPVSIVLFFVGAAFLLVVVSPLLLHFLLGYRTSVPELDRYMPKWLVPGGRPKPIPVHGGEGLWPSTQPIAVFEEDPEDPPERVPWINLSQREVYVRLGDEVYGFGHLQRVIGGNRVEPDIRIGELIPLVLHLAAAFGIGFQVPVVVAFLAAIGVASSEEMARYRRHVWLVMAVAAAMITPPDVTSMLALLGPMALLFEIGLMAARFLERERAGEA